MRCVAMRRVRACGHGPRTIASAGAPCVLVSLLFTVQYSLSFPHFPPTRSVCSHSCSRVQTPKPLLLLLLPPPPPPSSLTLNSRVLIYFLLLLTSQLFISLILLPLSPKSRNSSMVRLFSKPFPARRTCYSWCYVHHGVSRWLFIIFFQTVRD